MIDKQIAMQAAQWFVLMDSGEASEAEIARLTQWRADNSEHERAWQKALTISQRSTLIPAQVARQTLCRPANVQRRRVTATLAALICVPALGILAYRAVPRANHFETATGQQQHITLADGTRLQLNTGTEITVKFTDTQREVLLHQGEIWIETAKDPQLSTHGQSRMFRVKTGQGTVRAIGTRFTVRQTDQRSKVAVFEGAVAILPAYGKGGEQQIDAGGQAVFTNSEIVTTASVSPGDRLWTRGVLSVEDMRLDTFAEELSRYRPGIIRCDPAIAHLRITGAFQINDTDAALQNVMTLLPVDLTMRTRYWVTLVPRPA